jgi:uncharacterized membrane protein YbhN (UPF0104 family)
MRRWLSLAARVGVSAALLYYAFSSVNTAVIRDRLHDLKTSWLIVAIALGCVQVALLAARWQIIAHACHAALKFGLSLRLSLIATFFNQVLPSSVGGDAMRVWLFARGGAGWTKATHSVLLDRFVGVLTLAIVVVCCLPWSLTLIQSAVGRTALLVIGLGSIAGAAAFLALGMLRWAWLGRWAPLRHLTQMSATARQFMFSLQSGGTVLALSLSIHALTAAMAWCGAQAIGAPFGYFQALELVPPVILITTVPISVAGWGVREKSLVLAFAYAGLAPGDGFLVSILLGASMFAVGILGGLAWLGGTERAKAAAAMVDLKSKSSG